MAKSCAYNVYNIKRRGVFAAIALSLITSGIYAIYWYVKITDDSNAISDELNNGHKTAGGGKAILFTLLSFGIYNIYWAYKLGKKLEQNCLVYVFFALIGGWIINFAFAQREINLVYDELQKQQSENAVTKDSYVALSESCNPFNALTLEEFTSSGLPAELFDYLCELKPGDILLNIFDEGYKKPIVLNNGELRLEFTRERFSAVPIIKNGNVELYVALKPLSEPLKSNTDKVLFKARRDIDGFSILDIVTDEKLINELNEEQKRMAERLKSK